MLTPEETKQLITLLAKVAVLSGRNEVAGCYEIVVTPTIYAPEDFVPKKRVYLHSVASINPQSIKDATQIGESAGSDLIRVIKA